MEMLQKYKNLISYIAIIVIVFLLVKGCDYITKKPTPIDRALDPRIHILDSIIASLQKERESEKHQRDSANKAITGVLSRIEADNLKAKKQHENLNKIPDTDLQHYRDSIRRANGL